MIYLAPKCFARATAALLLMLASSSGFAQASRTWVSGVGDDANPCSRTAPCRTFAGAISKTAAGGEINVIDAGSYGSVTITKAITIDGEGSGAVILASGTNGVVVNAGASDAVTLRNLSINGIGSGLSGVRFLEGAALHMENVSISRFTQRGIEVIPVASSPEVFLTNVEIREVLGQGAGAALLRPTLPQQVNASFDRVQFNNNNYGIRAEAGSSAQVSNSSLGGNTNNGILALGGTVAVVGCTIAGNGSIVNSGGLKAEGAGSMVRVSNSLITRNLNGLVAAGGGQIVSLGNNALLGNTTDGNPTSTVMTR